MKSLVIQRILHPQLNRTWLLTGEGDMRCGADATKEETAKAALHTSDTTGAPYYSTHHTEDNGHAFYYGKVKLIGL